MTQNTFYLDYNVSGAERKRLVEAISAYTQADAKYLGAPTFAYEVDYFTIDKNGCVSFDDRADSEEIEGLIETLVSQGFVAQVSDLGCEDAEDTAQEATAAETEEPAQEAEEAATEPDSAEDGEQAGLTVSLPLDGFSADALDRLRKLVDCKAYRAWASSISRQEDEVEMDDFLWDKEVADFIGTLRKAGIQTFVYTNQSTAVMENLHAFAAEGCTMTGLCTITRRESRWGDEEPVEVMGIRFSLN